MKLVLTGVSNGGQGSVIPIGRQWPELLDQVVLSQKLKKKVAITYFNPYSR